MKVTLPPEKIFNALNVFNAVPHQFNRLIDRRLPTETFLEAFVLRCHIPFPAGVAIFLVIVIFFVPATDAIAIASASAAVIIVMISVLIVVFITFSFVFLSVRVIGHISVVIVVLFFVPMLTRDIKALYFDANDDVDGKVPRHHYERGSAFASAFQKPRFYYKAAFRKTGFNADKKTHI
ncbi:Hypothetical Protein FCC1311_109402 [Hondaea fermentalgiana]|uniref:Uncharacterized protein n=1 Tax=Hondaea fermentalgiana TaxID=2315210 RepID=A0A2R5GY39_9STRA|nr:Hypothetical Protein FCC1311_109402 [Hondaea fermentalgiana]|eukprot:GBG34718.1 Hypothetical Protein FCC1311_109402 [Hondaea fermentalgiana]